MSTQPNALTNTILKPNLRLPLSRERDLISRFQDDVAKTGLVGEKQNAAIVLLASISAKLDQPINVTVCGESSSGKNFLLGKVATFLPSNMTKFLTGMTPKALMHSAENEFEHTAVFIAEYEGVKGADYAIRTMQSEQVIAWDFVDTKNGIKKKSHKVKGPAAFLQATTRSVLHPENETRMLFIQIDESAELTKAINQRQARAAAHGEKSQCENVAALWQTFINTLVDTSVRIPFAERIAPFFPDARVRSRRDFPKFLALIETSAYLHQHQRERIEENGTAFVLASPDDYRIAKELFEHCYSVGPDKAVGELISAAETLHNQEEEFQAADLMRETGWGKSKVYEILGRAQELGCVAEGATRGLYRFLRTNPVPPLQLPQTI